MKRYNHLFEQVVSFENLLAAAHQAMRGKKMKPEVAKYYFHLERVILNLESELAAETYRPSPYSQFEIREPKVRQIASSDFRDRIAHHAICRVVDPFFEKRLIYDTYACRIGKGSHIALRRCQEFAHKNKYFLKCDIQKYFESVDHILLKRLLSRIFKDKKLLRLLNVIIDHVPKGYTPGKGLPIGNLTSQYFANLYLGELDHFLKERIRIKSYLRYMDDFICFADSKEELHRSLAAINEFCRDQLDLKLKEKVVCIAPVTEGVPFLGFQIHKGVIRLQRKNWVRMRKKMKKIQEDYKKGKVTEEFLVHSMRSRIAHVSHANSVFIRRKELEEFFTMY